MCNYVVYKKAYLSFFFFFFLFFLLVFCLFFPSNEGWDGLKLASPPMWNS